MNWKLRPGRRPGYAELRPAKDTTQDQRARLIACRFRWSNRFRCWYGPGSIAQQLADEFNR